MRSVDNNPSSNVLPSGILEENIRDAVATSGYPLQLVASNILRNKFIIYEEWAFTDSDSGQVRALDIFCEKRFQCPLDKSPQVRPVLNLLLECKSSELPFVFFLTDNKQSTTAFPYMAGLQHSEIKIKTNDTRNTHTASLQHALGLDEHAFVTSHPAQAALFSKCARAGKKVVLSGDEPFNSLSLPLVKALHHFGELEKPSPSHRHYDCHLALAIAVVKAPMVTVKTTESGEELNLAPWVRVNRHVGEKDTSHEHRNEIVSYDVVHIDFLEQYIDEHVLPFAEFFTSSVVKLREVLASGKGYADNYNARPWVDTHNRLRAKR